MSLARTICALGAALAVLSGCSAPAPAPAASVPAAAPSPTPSATSPTPRPAASTSPSASPKPAATLSPGPPAADRRTGAALDRPFLVKGLIVVSKKHPISSRYVPVRTSPNGLTAATQRALSRLTAAARVAGVRIVVRSGYRSYTTQASILASKIREYGSESMARRYNAAPGRSEHQTGLAVDLYDGVTWGLGVRNTRTGKWLWANAWRYGFILRYPPGKEGITGYAYEPWHFRYVGTQHSIAFGARSSKTLEEYLGIR